MFASIWGSISGFVSANLPAILAAAGAAAIQELVNICPWIKSSTIGSALANSAKDALGKVGQKPVDPTPPTPPAA